MKTFNTFSLYFIFRTPTLNEDDVCTILKLWKLNIICKPTFSFLSKITCLWFLGIILNKASTIWSVVFYYTFIYFCQLLCLRQWTYTFSVFFVTSVLQHLPFSQKLAKAYSNLFLATEKRQLRLTLFRLLSLKRQVDSGRRRNGGKSLVDIDFLNQNIIGLSGYNFFYIHTNSHFFCYCIQFVLLLLAAMRRWFQLLWI